MLQLCTYVVINKIYCNFKLDNHAREIVMHIIVYVFISVIIMYIINILYTQMVLGRAPNR